MQIFVGKPEGGGGGLSLHDSWVLLDLEELAMYVCIHGAEANNTRDKTTPDLLVLRDCVVVMAMMTMFPFHTVSCARFSLGARPRVAGSSSTCCATGGRCCLAPIRRREARGWAVPSSPPRTPFACAPRGPADTLASGQSVSLSVGREGAGFKVA